MTVEMVDGSAAALAQDQLLVAEYVAGLEGYTYLEGEAAR